jgi:hypothetical protein
MRCILAVAMLLVACVDKESAPKVALPAPRPPLGLIGDWVRVAPQSLRGDTLSLRADSTARGLIPWYNDSLARITRWRVVFGAHEPPTERADWRQGHSDGGDFDCMRGLAKDCQGLPLICLHAGGEAQCEAFHYAPPDTLGLSSGLRYVRARPPHPSPPS